MYFSLVYWICPCLHFLFSLSGSLCCLNLSFMWLKVTFCFLNMPATWQLLFISLYQFISYLCMYVCISPSFLFQILPVNTSFHNTAFYYQVFVCQSRQTRRRQNGCAVVQTKAIYTRESITQMALPCLFWLTEKKMWHYWIKLNKTALWNNNWIWNKELRNEME